jgi:type IV pilus assembly protein PilC
MPLLDSHPSRKEVCLFTRQLATIIRAGVPLLSALEILKRQTSSTALQRAIERVHETVLDGGSLASGFQASPKIFDRLYVSLVSSGEQAGILDQTLPTLSKSLERSQALRARLLRAAIYPAVILGTLGIVTIFLLTWVIPTFEELFHESGVQLPWLTNTTLGLSRTITSYWSYLLACTGCALLGAWWAVAHCSSVSLLLERLALRVPLAATLIRSKLASEFSSLLSALLGAGIPIIEALEIASDTVLHATLSNELSKTRDRIHEGFSLAESLTQSTVLPTLVTQMVRIGETSGQVPEMLAKAGTLFEEEVDTAIKTLHDLAEPALIILIGVIVGTLVLAIYLPLFQIGEVASVR